MIMRVLLPAVLALVAIACSSESSTSKSFKCCINGAYYSCNTDEEQRSCGTQNMKCPRDSAKDGECK